MRENGKMIKLKAKELANLQTAIIIMVIGSMIIEMVMDIIYGKTKINTKVYG